MLPTKQKAAIKLSAILIIVLAISYAGFKEASHHFEKHQEQKLYAPIAKLINIPDDATIIQTADIVRNFVYRNSIHKIDEKYYRYNSDHKALSDQMISFANQTSPSAPHMECSTRSRTMKYILKNVGIEARKIDVYAPENDFASHVFLEVRDPETDEWHIQDPDHNLSWIVSKTSKRANVEDLIKLNISQLQLCAGIDCNKQKTKTKERKLSPYYGLAFFKNEKKDQKITLWNKKKFPPRTTLEIDTKQKTICDFRKELCEHTILEVE